MAYSPIQNDVVGSSGLPVPVSPPAGLSRGIARSGGLTNTQYNNMLNGGTSGIIAVQKALKARGYNVDITGIKDAKTNAATSAYFNGVAPYQVVLPTSKAAAKAPARPVMPVSPAAPAVNIRTPARAKEGSVSGARNTIPGTIPAGANNSGVQGPGAFNPLTYAQDAANAQYDPAISSLQGQVNNLNQQEPGFVQAIMQMYQQAQQQYQQLVAGEQGQNIQAQADLGQAYNNAGQLFGQSNQGLMATPQGIAQGELAGVNQSEQDYLKNMQPIMKASGASQINNAQSQFTGQINNLLGQLQQQQQAKGNAFATDYQQGISNESTLQQNAQQMAIDQALFPAQYAAANATAKADVANAAAAPGLNAAKIAAAQGTAAYDAARIPLIAAQTTKDLADARKAAASAGNVLVPGSASTNRIITTLQKDMMGPKGKVLVGDPTVAQGALFQSAVAQGLITQSGQEIVKGAANMLYGVLQNMYQRSPEWRSGWTWNGKTFSKK